MTKTAQKSINSADMMAFLSGKTLVTVKDGVVTSAMFIPTAEVLKDTLGLKDPDEKMSRHLLFSSRFRELRNDLELSQKEMADKIAEMTGHEISYITVSAIENGRRYPAIDDLISICKGFEISADYLLGMSPDPDLEVRKGKTVTFNERFAELMDKNELSSRMFAECLEDITDGRVSRGNMYASMIANGHQKANVAILPEMAKIFEVSIDYLLGLAD